MPATLCASRAALREKCEECKQIELTRTTRDDGECSLLWREKRTNEVMARASAIACGYEDAIDDAIDLDRLRHDPLLKVAVWPLSSNWGAAGVAIDHLWPRKCAEQDRGGRLSAALLDQFGTTVKPGKLERRGAGAACKFRFFHGVGCSSACGVRFALVFERGIREHSPSTNACQSLPVRAILGVAHAAVRRSGRTRSMRSRRRLE